MRLINAITFVTIVLGMGILVRGPDGAATDLPNRIPEAAPYITAEARVFPPPYEEHWQTQNHPGQCQSCHRKIFDEWNGSMMSNAWRDPVWRAAFLLLARSVSTHRRVRYPGAARRDAEGDAQPVRQAGELRLGVRHRHRQGDAVAPRVAPRRVLLALPHAQQLRRQRAATDGGGGSPDGDRIRPGRSRIPPHGGRRHRHRVRHRRRAVPQHRIGQERRVLRDLPQLRDHAGHAVSQLSPRGHGVRPRRRSGLSRRPDGARRAGHIRRRRSGHAEPRLQHRGRLVPPVAPRHRVPRAIRTARRHRPPVADRRQHQPGFRRDRPLPDPGSGQARGIPPGPVRPVGDVRRLPRRHQRAPHQEHPGPVGGGIPHRAHLHRVGEQPVRGSSRQRELRPALQARLPVLPHAAGLWPAGHRADLLRRRRAAASHRQGRRRHRRPPAPVLHPPLRRRQRAGAAPHRQGRGRVGECLALPRAVHVQLLVGGPSQPLLAGVLHPPRAQGRVCPASAPGLGSPPPRAQHGPPRTGRGAPRRPGADHGDRRQHRQRPRLPHRVPRGADRLARGPRVRPRHRRRASHPGRGVEPHLERRGGAHDRGGHRPSFPGCNWRLPPASVDPFAVQFKAVASLGDGCPTLDLPYAAPLNLVTDSSGLPIDARGQRIDAATNPNGLPQFRDLDGDGEAFDDAFLTDTRLRPLPHPGATRAIDRYAVVVPPGTRGPIPVTAAVYYQSVEAVVAAKFLGNMVDTNGNFVLEPCVLGGRCDGRTPQTEPAVVEGAPPVPMAVRSITIPVAGAPADTTPPRVGTYPAAGAESAHVDVVVKAFFSEPVTGVDAHSFTLRDSHGALVPAGVDPIGDGAFGLFPHEILFVPGETYTARLEPGVCDAAANCTRAPVAWSFTVAADVDAGRGDTGIPTGFSGASAVVVSASRGETFVIDAATGRRSFRARASSCAGIVAGRDVAFAMPIRGCVANTLVDRRTGRRCNVWCE